MSVIVGYMRLCKIHHLVFDALSKQVVRWTSAILCRMKFDTQANDAWISFYTEQDKLTLKSIPTVQLELLKLAEVPYQLSVNAGRDRRGRDDLLMSFLMKGLTYAPLREVRAIQHGAYLLKY